MINVCPDRFLSSTRRALSKEVTKLAAEARRLLIAADSVGDTSASLALGDIAKLADKIADRGRL